MTDSLNELQRRNYLGYMGYQVYYPRFLLPGAKSSPQYEIPEKIPGSGIPIVADNRAVSEEKNEASKTVANTDITRSKAEAIAARERARRNRPDLSQKPANAKDRTKEQKKPAVKIASEGPLGELRFNLLYFAIDSQLAVISEVPPHQNFRQKKDCSALLLSILRALRSHAPGSDPELRREAFNWPLAEGIVDDEPKKAAALTLQGFVNKRQANDRFSNLLVLTSQLAHILTGDDEAEPKGDVVLENFDCQVTLTHSLHSMLAYPPLKREVWSHLQALRGRLQC
ncbi:MAG: hypothetical protein OXD01_03870 [Gammaproteobacteria bacterium]|nr:hypothetical protein [Gammaproteobacteria bacterium]